MADTYTKQGPFNNLTEPSMNASRMTAIDQGVLDAHELIDALSGEGSTVISSVGNSGDDTEAQSNVHGTYASQTYSTHDSTATVVDVRRNYYGMPIFGYQTVVALLEFDTAALLPDDAVVESATLRLYVTDKDNTDTRSIVGDHHSILNNSSDWALAAPGSPILSATIASLATGATNDIPLTDVSGVETTSTTTIRLHVSGGQPTGENGISFAAFDHATLPQAVLVINYSTAGGGGGDVTAHLADASDAHDASAISIADSGNNFSATNVEDALAEEADARQAHEADASDAHDASAISISDSGNNFAATNVETALAEEADARQAHEADTADAHDATAISFAPGASGMSSTDANAAIIEAYEEALSGGGGGGGVTSIEGLSGVIDVVSTGGFAHNASGGILTLDGSGLGGTATGMTSVETVAALRAIDTTNATNFPTGTCRIVLGYSSVSDKAEARIYRLNRSSSDVHNGGTVLSPTTGTGRWELQHKSNVLDVSWFGAKGDYNANTGTGTDDTAAIQECIDQAPSRGAMIVFPHGTYKLTSPLDVDTTGIVFMGQGNWSWNEGRGVLQGATLCPTVAGDYAFHVREGATSTVHQGNGFVDLNFIDDSNYRSGGVFTTLTNRIWFLHCSFREMLRGTLNDSVAYLSSGQGHTWTANTAKLLGHRIWKNVSGTFRQYAVVAVDSGFAGTTGSSEPTWPTTPGNTVDDGTLTWVHTRVMQNGGDVSWVEYMMCTFSDVKESIYVAHQGNIHVNGGSIFGVTGSGANAPNTKGINISGGGHHRVHDIKIEEVEVGIEHYGAGSHFHDIVYEDCETAVWMRENDGVASGQNNSVDGIYMGASSTTGPRGIVCDAGTSGVIGPRRRFSSVPSGSQVIINSADWKVSQPTSVSSGYTE